MKKLYLLIAIIMPQLMACGEWEASDNGELDGFWQLCSVDTLATGGTAHVASAGLTWAIQGRILELRDLGSTVDVYYHFSHEGDSLLLSAPHVLNRNEEDPPITSPDDWWMLQFFGVQQPEEHFLIERLSGGRMVLRSVSHRLSLRKL